MKQENSEIILKWPRTPQPTEISCKNEDEINSSLQNMEFAKDKMLTEENK